MGLQGLQAKKSAIFPRPYAVLGVTPSGVTLGLQGLQYSDSQLDFLTQLKGRNIFADNEIPAQKRRRREFKDLREENIAGKLNAKLRCF